VAVLKKRKVKNVLRIGTVYLIIINILEGIKIKGEIGVGNEYIEVGIGIIIIKIIVGGGMIIYLN